MVVCPRLRLRPAPPALPRPTPDMLLSRTSTTCWRSCCSFRTRSSGPLSVSFRRRPQAHARLDGECLCRPLGPHSLEVLGGPGRGRSGDADQDRGDTAPTGDVPMTGDPRGNLRRSGYVDRISWKAWAVRLGSMWSPRCRASGAIVVADGAPAFVTIFRRLRPPSCIRRRIIRPGSQPFHIFLSGAIALTCAPVGQPTNTAFVASACASVRLCTASTRRHPDHVCINCLKGH